MVKGSKKCLARPHLPALASDALILRSETGARQHCLSKLFYKALYNGECMSYQNIRIKTFFLERVIFTVFARRKKTSIVAS